MATPSRIGTFTIVVDGEWDIEDLRNVSEGLSEAYGLFYPLVAQDEVVRERLQDSLRETFWSGNVDSRFIGERLYRQIPFDESLKLKSFHYSSQGAMTVVGVLGVLGLMAGVTRAWMKAASDFLDLWKKVERFFEKRPHLRRTKKQFELDDEIALTSDEARALVFDVGVTLGFTHQSCDVLIGIVGNPISPLSFSSLSGKKGAKWLHFKKKGSCGCRPPQTMKLS